MSSSSASASSSSSSARYVLRSPTSKGARLSQVDAVLDRLKRQRRREEGRAWIDSRQRSDNGVGDGAEGAENWPEEEQEQQEVEEEEEEEAAINRKRARPERSAAAAERAVDEDDIGDDDDAAFIVGDDEEAEAEGEGEGGEAEADSDGAIGHMRLLHRMQMEQEGLREDDDDPGGNGDEGSHSHSLPSSSPLFASLSLSLPLDLPSALRVYALYLSAVLVDAEVSGWAMSLPSIDRLLNAAAQKVEESFVQQRTLWVRSQLWEQAGRAESFLRPLDRLPYATSTRAQPADAMDPQTGVRLAQSPCAACGRAHELTHTVRLFGVPYDEQQLQHPFEPQDIFSGQPRTA